jgi:hypothetical protein
MSEKTLMWRLVLAVELLRRFTATDAAVEGKDVMKCTCCDGRWIVGLTEIHAEECAVNNFLKAFDT